MKPNNTNSEINNSKIFANFLVNLENVLAKDDPTFKKRVTIFYDNYRILLSGDVSEI